jgi:farnesol dehydrogenase
MSYLDFFNTISDISGKEYFMFRVPMIIALAIASGFSLVARLTGIPPLITPGWIKKYLHDWSVSSAKAMNELGYDPGSFREEVGKTLAWLETNQVST